MLTYESKWIYANKLLTRVVIIIITMKGYTIAGLLVVATERKLQITKKKKKKKNNSKYANC
jgi:hypothetical protein